MSDRWPALLTQDEAAAYLGIGITSLKGLRASEQINSVRIAGAIRYRKTDLDDYIAGLAIAKGEFRGKRERVK